MSDLIEAMLTAFNGGLVNVPDDKNARGYTTKYLPKVAMSAALAALRETHHLVPKDQEPVGWLHTLHMEQGQTYERLLDHDGTDCDDPRRTAFGVPGRDYSEEYEVTSIPLYALEQRHD